MTERASRRVKRPSGFRVEIRRSANLLDRWLGHELNRFFDLSVGGASYRAIRTLVVVLAIGVLAFLIHMLLVVGPLEAVASSNQLPELFAAAVISALRIALVLGIAVLFALQVAGNYLADIFEIKDPRIAYEFIGSTISGRGSEVLHLHDGLVADEDRDSPIVLIGGPGYVVTENDTAALFETPDGAPHVAGPGSGREDRTTFRLAGFERLREPIVNLRDQYIGSLGGEPMTVVSRSLDGMPISAVDVRGVYSIRRQAEDDASGPSREVPYGLDPAAIQDLIYNQEVQVLTDGPYPSGRPAAWTNTMQALIQAALAEFMRHDRLGQYVAGVGDKEVELSEFREDTILSQTLRLSTDITGVDATRNLPKPRFHPRTELTARFLDGNDEFARRAREHGLELHWIGVGTWEMPDHSSSEVVREKHLEAWRLHRESSDRADPKALQAISDEALISEKLRLIRDVPIGSHQRNQEKYSDKDVLVECLLQDFWEQMGDALNACYEAGPLAPEQLELEAAVSDLEQMLKIRQLGYLVGGETMSRVRPRPAATKVEPPPAPASKSESDKYRALLGKLGGDFRIAEGMITNEGKRHRNLSREELIQRILVRFERYGH